MVKEILRDIDSREENLFSSILLTNFSKVDSRNRGDIQHVQLIYTLYPKYKLIDYVLDSSKGYDFNVKELTKKEMSERRYQVDNVTLDFTGTFDQIWDQIKYTQFTPFWTEKNLENKEISKELQDKISAEVDLPGQNKKSLKREKRRDRKK